ncbi:PucR family transcriptional regulator [Nocardia brevicatena]|uniref:PucR family transcriptional regulator n=1 Tax=Nocardia brevicatena TaxID=37327 RepID=UPI000305E2E3|nr:helix-turn-helix domain-containing protein [Nocardia brevicatena]
MSEHEEPLRRVVQRILRDHESLIRSISLDMRTQVPELDSDPRLRELIEAGTTDNLLAALDFLQSEAGPEQVRVPARAVVFAKVLAQRDIPLSALTRSYRIGHAAFLDFAMNFAVELAGEASSTVIIRMVHRTAQYIDQVSEQIIRAYEDEHVRWVDTRSGTLREWVRRVLHDPGTDIAAAQHALRYPLTGRHLAVTVWSDPGVSTEQAAAALGGLRDILAPVVEASGMLMVPTDEHEARVWFAVTADSVLDPAAVEAAMTKRASPLRLAIGGYGHGPTGFREAAHRADRVRGVALIPGTPVRPVTSYDQVAALILLSADLETLRKFVADCLRGLATDDERSTRLRQTLRTFLATNGSFAATAHELGLHRNTVHYRVQQAMELLGSSTEDPHRDLHLRLALHAAHWMGPAVLRTAPSE